MKTHIRRTTAQNLIHQAIKQKHTHTHTHKIKNNKKKKTKTQKYRLGTISNTKSLAGLNQFYMAITSPSASAVVHNFGPLDQFGGTRFLFFINKAVVDRSNHRGAQTDRQ